MADRVGIVAVSQTNFKERVWDQALIELAYQVTQDVMRQTGLEFREDGTGIDATMTASQDMMGSSHMSISYVTGGTRRPDERVEEDGTMGVFYGAAQILSGHHDIVLVVSYLKESQPDPTLMESRGMDPAFERRIGLDYHGAAALQAMRYMHKYGITPKQCAQVVVKNRKNAKNNPFAQCCGDLTVKEVLKSPMFADPIRELDCKPTPSDGAVAMILACEEKARKLTDKPVWIKGLGCCYDYYHVGDRDLANCDSLVSAAKRAYKMAGITDPVKEIDLAEIVEKYSYQELLWTEGLGFCGKGEGGKLIDSGATQMGGQIPVNPSGGMLSGLPLIVGGMHGVVECALQLRGEAGARQVPGAKTALAQGHEGPAGQLHCVIILEK